MEAPDWSTAPRRSRCQTARSSTESTDGVGDLHLKFASLRATVRSFPNDRKQSKNKPPITSHGRPCAASKLSSHAFVKTPTRDQKTTHSLGAAPRRATGRRRGAAARGDRGAPPQDGAALPALGRPARRGARVRRGARGEVRAARAGRAQLGRRRDAGTRAAVVTVVAVVARATVVAVVARASVERGRRDGVPLTSWWVIPSLRLVAPFARARSWRGSGRSRAARAALTSLVQSSVRCAAASRALDASTPGDSESPPPSTPSPPVRPPCAPAAPRRRATRTHHRRREPFRRE